MDGPHKHSKSNVCICDVNICYAAKAVSLVFEDELYVCVSSWEPLQSMNGLLVG